MSNSFTPVNMSTPLSDAQIIAQFSDCYRNMLSKYKPEYQKIATDYFGYAPGATVLSSELDKNYANWSPLKKMQFKKAMVNLDEKLVNDGLFRCIEIIGIEDHNTSVFKDIPHLSLLRTASDMFYKDDFYIHVGDKSYEIHISPEDFVSLSYYNIFEKDILEWNVINDYDGNI